MDRVCLRPRVIDGLLTALVGERALEKASSDALLFDHEKSREPRVPVTRGTWSVFRCRNAPVCGKEDEDDKWGKFS